MKTAQWVIIAAMCISAPALAQTTPDAPSELRSDVPTESERLQKKIDVLLGGIERTPTAADWAKLGEPAVPLLIEAMNDPDAKIIRRGRAAIGLSYFKTPASATALRAVVTDTSTPTLLLRKSIVALVLVDGPASLGAVKPHLEHRSKRVREQAIKAVASIGTADARVVLKDRKALEKSSYLRDLIAKELERPAPEIETSLTGVKQ